MQVLTTTKRYGLLSEDMDVNGGEFLDGRKTLGELGEDTLELLVNICSGWYAASAVIIRVVSVLCFVYTANSN